nr:uncharacterized protein LOC112016268 [Quercus suber]
MADDVTSIMEKMKLTSEEEVVIEIPEEGRKEGMESCALSLIGKFLTCRPFNKKAAISTMKRAWGLEEGVQMIEVGTNLFQLKFRTEFEMERVLKGGPWSFDNQVLLLTRWKVQIWGTPFDLVSPKTAETVGGRLGSVVEVETKQKTDGQSYFMRVKVAILIAKPIRRGAFLAGFDGDSHWVTFKYERLPLFCHFCGLLGHDMKHCAPYFAAAKNDGEVMYQYDDWLKATRGRARSPPRRKYGREESGVEVDRQADWFRQANHEEANGDGGGDKLQNPREHDPLRDKGNNDKHGTTLEGANVATEIKESMEATMKVMGSSIYVEQSSKVDDVAESMQELPVDPVGGSQSPKKKPTWARLRRMEIGPVELFKEGAKSVLGKRMSSSEEPSQVEVEQSVEVKRVKSGGDSNSEETAGVSMHPCRAQ